MRFLIHGFPYCQGKQTMILDYAFLTPETWSRNKTSKELRQKNKSSRIINKSISSAGIGITLRPAVTDAPTDLTLFPLYGFNNYKRPATNNKILLGQSVPCWEWEVLTFSPLRPQVRLTAGLEGAAVQFALRVSLNLYLGRVPVRLGGCTGTSIIRNNCTQQNIQYTLTYLNYCIIYLSYCI